MRIIKELRKQNKVGQKELADYLEIGVSALSQYETGKRRPDLDTLSKIAEFFNVSTDYLLGRVNKPTATIPDELKFVGIEWIEFVNNCKDTGLTPDQLQELIDVAKKLKR